MPLLIVGVALLGLAIGSFLNVVILRLPAQESLSHPPSRCPECDHPIRARHNIPVLGWILLRGRCADCGVRINVRYPVIELLTAILFVGIALQVAHLELLPALPAYLLFGAMGIALSAIDIDVHRLPNAIVLPAYPVLAVLLTIAALLLHDPSTLVRAAVGAVGLFSFYFVLAFAYPAGMGFGDVKLAGIVGAVLGFLSYQALLVGAMAAFLLGSVVGIGVVISRGGNRKTMVPFGPFMIVGVLVALFASGPISDVYSHLVLPA